MAKKNDISWKEKAIVTVKQFILFVCAIVTALISTQSFLRSSMKDMIKEAMTEYVIPIQRDVEGMKPLVNKHEYGFNLLEYRMGMAEQKLLTEHVPNREAILPHETKIEEER